MAGPGSAAAGRARQIAAARRPESAGRARQIAAPHCGQSLTRRNTSPGAQSHAGSAAGPRPLHSAKSRYAVTKWSRSWSTWEISSELQWATKSQRQSQNNKHQTHQNRIGTLTSTRCYSPYFIYISIESTISNPSEQEQQTDIKIQNQHFLTTRSPINPSDRC